MSEAPPIAPPSDPALDAPLSAAEFARFGGLTRRLPLRWTATRRRRRLLFLALAAPGFLAVFATPAHRSVWLFGLGLLLFAAAVLFRGRSEPMFVRAEAAALWPPALWSAARPVPAPPTPET